MDRSLVSFDYGLSIDNIVLLPKPDINMVLWCSALGIVLLFTFKEKN